MSVNLRLGGRRDAGVVLEELLVQLGEVLPLLGDFVFREDRLHRTHRLTGAAIDALVGMDIELGGRFECRLVLPANRGIA